MVAMASQHEEKWMYSIGIQMVKLPWLNGCLAMEERLRKRKKTKISSFLAWIAEWRIESFMETESSGGIASLETNPRRSVVYI